MIASWIVFALLVGALVSVASEAADRLLRTRRLPARWVWVTALAFSAGWPLWLAYGPQGASVAVSSPLAVTVQSAAAVVAETSRSTLRVDLDALLVALWGLASAVVAIRLAHGVITLAWRKRQWRTASVDGVDVRVSADVGPAVVGLRPMEVVLPDWALSLDAPLRAIVLRHEEEHRRAGDPALLAFAALLLVIAPWNVAFWWQSRRLRLAIELDCDARVLGAFPHPERYGLLLLSIAQRRSGALARLATGLLEPAHHLERRIAAMSPGSGSLSRARITALGAVGLVAIVAACNADAPPQPVPRAAAAADTLPTLHIAAPGPADVNDSLLAETRETIEQFRKMSNDAAGMDDALREMKRVIEEFERVSVTTDGRVLPTDSVAEILGRFRAAVDEYDRLGRSMRGIDSLIEVRERPVVERGTVGRVLPIVERGTVGTPPTQQGRRGNDFQHVLRGDTGDSSADLTREVRFTIDGGPAHWDFQVDVPAQWIQGSGAPHYPEMLKAAGVTGSVLASFVVGTDGRADLSSFKVLRSSQELFSVAVRKALADMRFRPAEAGGRKVKQVLQQEFVFSITP